MDEMVQDVMAMGDEDDIEEEADAEVDKVLFEMTDGLLGQAGQVGAELQVGYMCAFFLLLMILIQMCKKTSPVADKTAALKARMAALKE